MRVALLDPGSEGLALAATLRGAGFDVELAGLESITALIADVLVLAGDAPGALASLRALRDDGVRPDMPVVLVGTPPGMPVGVQGPAFGADWALSRDAAENDLPQAVRHVVARAARQSDAPGLRERTFDLGLELGERSQVSARRDAREDDESEHEADEASGVREPPSGEIEVPARLARTSDPAPRSHDFSDASSVEIAFDAPVSPALASLLLAADRRVFPHLPPTDPSLPRGESRARDLVPDSLLFLPASEPEEEPVLDSLTFVGAVPEVRPDPLPRTSSGLSVSGIARALGGPASEPPMVTPAARRRSERPRLAAPLEGKALRPSTHPGLPTPTRAPTEPKEPSEREILGQGDALAWIRALRERLVSGVTSIFLEEDAGKDAARRATLVIRDGVVLSLRAPLASTVLAALDGVAVDARGEEEAELELSRRRDGGLVSPHRLVRLRSDASRAWLSALLGTNVHFRIGPGQEPPRGTPRPFSRRLLPLLIELGASAIDRPQAITMLGARAGEGARVLPSGTYALMSRECELAPELDALLMQPAALGELLDAGWEEPSLPAALVVLTALGALEVRSREGASEFVPNPNASSQALAIRGWLEGLATRAEDADYFALLELSHEASAAEVSRAHAALSSRLVSLPLSALELAHLEPQRLSVLRAIDEAHRVLRVDRWRSAYRGAIER